METNEEFNDTKFVWNTLPSNKEDTTRIIIPPGFHYSPKQKKITNETLLEYDPVICNQCKAVLNPFVSINHQAKKWTCNFCKALNTFPQSYSDQMSEELLPTECLQEETTVEYKLSKKESGFPIFLFIIDTAIEEEDLIELKESIQSILSTIPQDCQVGIITYGNMCQVHEIGFSDYPVSYVFRGEKQYKTLEIQEQLGLININRNQTQKNIPHGQVNYVQNNKFILPIKDCEFAVTTFLDELQPDPWEKQQGERESRCGGLALHVAISLLEAVSRGDPARILFCIGGAISIGHGKIISKPLVETVRHFNDFQKGNDNTKYYKPAIEFYDILATRASKAGLIIDIFSCSMNQVGLYEMKKCVEKTGGLIILTDSFSNPQFKDSIKKIFELDENEILKMCFKAKLEIFSTNPAKLLGGMGHLTSAQVNSNNVSENKFGESGTKQWILNGLNDNSTYSFLLDLDNAGNKMLPKVVYFQMQTSYIHGDRSHRFRITTVFKKLLPELKATNQIEEISQSFDQEAAAVMIARMCVVKSQNEEPQDILNWIDKTLIRLVSKFAKYTKDNPSTFKIPKQFNMFPQFIFYLRRSPFIQMFNTAPDEVTYFKHLLMHETVSNGSIMIQPILLSYSAENPESTPMILDIQNMKNDCVLLLDSFFNVVIWHGDEVAKWRDANYHEDPEYVNIKQMLENPLEYAQSLVLERCPLPRFISCDSGQGNERLIKFVVNPSNTGIVSKNKTVEDGFVSDDVSLQVFMDFLIKLAVAS